MHTYQENLRQSINTLVDTYLIEEAQPRLTDVAELFGCSDYLHHNRRRKVITFKVGAFKDMLIQTLLHQSSVPLTLPSIFHSIDLTILPPDDLEILPGKGGIHLEEKEYIPRTQYLIELLSQREESYEIIGGKNTPDMMRGRTYFIFILKQIKKAIFVNNEEGNTTFIFHNVKNQEEALDLAQLTKDEIRAQELHSHTFSQIDWTGVKETWQARIAEGLMGDSEHIDKELKPAESGDVYESAPDGWLTVGGIAKKIGRADAYVLPKIKSLLTSHPHLCGKKYLDSRGHVFIHYPPVLIDHIEQGSLRYQKAPDGWMTMGGIAKKIGRSQKYLASTIKRLLKDHPDLQGKKYIDSVDNVRIHYPPTLIDLIEQETLRYQKAPDGWMTMGGIAKKIGRDDKYVIQKIESFLQEHPDLYGKEYLDSVGKVCIHYPPTLIDLIEQESLRCMKAPDGWMTVRGIAKKIGRDNGYVLSRIKSLLKSHPDLGGKEYLDNGGHVFTHYPPQLIEKLESMEKE